MRNCWLYRAQGSLPDYYYRAEKAGIPGYASTGVALINDEGLQVYKKKGKVAELEETLLGKSLSAHIGIGHTRWATHGEPSDVNAHPHRSAGGKLAMIHNGIIKIKINYHGTQFKFQ